MPNHQIITNLSKVTLLAASAFSGIASAEYSVAKNPKDPSEYLLVEGGRLVEKDALYEKLVSKHYVESPAFTQVIGLNKANFKKYLIDEKSKFLRISHNKESEMIDFAKSLNDVDVKEKQELAQKQIWLNDTATLAADVKKQQQKLADLAGVLPSDCCKESQKCLAALAKPAQDLNLYEFYFDDKSGMTVFPLSADSPADGMANLRFAKSALTSQDFETATRVIENKNVGGSINATWVSPKDKKDFKFSYKKISVQDVINGKATLPFSMSMRPIGFSMQYGNISDNELLACYVYKAAQAARGGQVAGADPAKH